jgi:hypothetical protein
MTTDSSVIFGIFKQLIWEEYYLALLTRAIRAVLLFNEINISGV